MAQTRKENSLVWMDLEMTGLDPERERILEIAVLLTDQDLEVIAEGPELVISQPEELLSAMDAWNQEHHARSGLLDRVRASKLSETQAEDQVMAFLDQYTEPKVAPLAGNSVHHDRRFLARYMPRIHQHLHYRIVDVTTVKELAQRWYPGVVEERPMKRNQHRAMDDIRESLDELRFYRRRVFRING
ncbi:MAG: oligoribonuclease [Planctomycetota bacterium]|nr:MAG: oligoribonuclease [Planctomycetota bacterium]